MRLSNIRCIVLFLCFIGFAQGAGAVTDTVSGEAYYVINEIKYTGNKVTKPQIITRELMFLQGDTIDVSQLPMVLQKTKENLLNTSLFNFVTIDTASASAGRLNVSITFAERWYTWPVPIFEIAERNFNTWWETRDLSKAIYGFYVTRDNFRGRKESLTFRAKFGYVQQYGVSYQIPYIDKNQRSGLGFSATYSSNHEIAYNTINNKLMFYKDPHKFIRTEIAGRVNYTYREGIYNTHSVDLRYNKGNIADTVQFLTNDYFTNNQTDMEYFSAQYLFKRDYRDSKVYPLKGYYFDFVVEKLGLGILSTEKLDLLYFQGTVKNYWKLAKRFYAGSFLRGRLSVTHNQPYYTQRALGFRDYVRAYEYYVVDGQNYGLMKAELRYEIVKPRVQKVPFIMLEKFNTIPYAIYISAFSDAAYVEDKINYRNNFLANTWLFGTGMGIDFVTYYDTVLRAEYSFNRLGQNGFFLHLSSPI